MRILAGAAIALYALAITQSDGYQIGGHRVPTFQTPSLSAAEFSGLHSAVKPSALDHGERWTEIPWMTELHAAREKAAKESKPLFMWIMDGHPLGCT